VLARAATLDLPAPVQICNQARVHLWYEKKFVRPNPVLAPPEVYRAKTDRWRRQWPALTVPPWPATA
jgi:hypothetical protein